MTGANAHDVTELIALVDAVPELRGRGRRPRRRLELIMADRAYDSRFRRAELDERGLAAEIPGRHQPHGSGLGRHRWVVERTFAWLHQLKRLLVRYDRRADIHEAFVALGCCLVCFRRLNRSF